MPILFPSRHDGTRLTSSTIYCCLDGDGCFNKFSPRWYSLCDKYQVEDFAPDRLMGRPVSSFVPPPWRAEIQARILSWLQGEPPSNPASSNPASSNPASSNPASSSTASSSTAPFDDSVWRAWSPWPLRATTPDGAPGMQLTLDPAAQTRLSWGLADPIWRGPHNGEGPLSAINAAARRLLAERPELANPISLQSWLNGRPQARRLVKVASLDLNGDTLWRADLPHLHGSSDFRLLSKLMRALLHDLSNPLAAVRMMAEVVSRGSRHYSDPSKVLPDMIRHLDLATATLRRLRSLAQIAPKVQSLDALSVFDDAAEILRSELDRREITVDLTTMAAPEPELEGRADALLLLALGTLLLTLSRAGEGDQLRLEASSDGEIWRLKGYLQSSGSPRPWFADPEIGIDALERLASSFDGRWLRLELDGKPMWELEIPL